MQRDHTSFAKNVHVEQCLVVKDGLESFIRAIVKQLDLHLEDNVLFDMNSQGILQRWEDVFLVEKTYTACLGISKRTYRCHGYTHEPDRRLTYFILDERNERSLPILPAFSFHVMIFCHYNAAKAVTRVEVQYDQLSFYLHCVGLEAFHRWTVRNIVTPLAYCWMTIFRATGVVNPITFLLQLVGVPLVALVWLLYFR